MKTAPEADTQIYSGLILAAALVFLVLPFTMTFNEFLTSIVIQLGLYSFIATYIAPQIAGMAGVILQALGFSVKTSGMLLGVEGAGRSIGVSIIWNCIGWQSLLLYAFTIAVGLKGSFTRLSKLLAVAIGIEGTILVNVIRVVLVILVSMFWGTVPSTLFHEYAGTIFVLLWLVAFWQLSYKLILQPVKTTTQ